MNRKLVNGRFVYVFFSEQLNEFYIGESDDYLSRLEKMNSGYYSVLPNFPNATDWIAHLVVNCSSKRQAVNLLKHFNAQPRASYFRSLIEHKWLLEELLLMYAS